jgi:phosphate transport system substrate-binding protein
MATVPPLHSTEIRMTRTTRLRLGLATTLFAASLCLASQAAEITGAGSSFVYPVLSKWSAAYNEKTGNKVNYQSIGSGGGIAQIEAATVDFGASDKPLSAAELRKFGLGQFPVVVGGIVPVINVPGVATGAMKLDGAVLGDIFLGKIKRWNEPAIAALNPGITLPDTRITVVHRSDGSGTTFNFSNYLSKVNPEWKAKVGEGTSLQWPSGIGGKGNEGVSAYVRQITGGIGYVEYAYALQNKLAYSRMKNAAGKFVLADDKAFAAAAASADWVSAQDFNLIMTNAPGDAAWPITATTWAIMYKHSKKPAQTRAALDFFKWSFEEGQAQAASLDYVPLPPALVQKIEAYWAQNLK